MKKAEIIKNGMLDLELIVVNPTESEIEAIKKAFAENNEKWNVNLKPINTKIDWRGVKLDFFDSKVYAEIADHEVINIDRLLDWFKKRIEKELNQ